MQHLLQANSPCYSDNLKTMGTDFEELIYRDTFRSIPPPTRIEIHRTDKALDLRNRR